MAGTGMAYSLGVDLGTTSTAAAIEIGRDASMLTLGISTPEIPSVVAITDDGILVGEPASRRALHEPDRVAREFKRRLGDSTPLIVAGTPRSAAWLMAQLLSHVVETASTLQGAPPDRITLTHPANWGEYKRESLREVAQLAGAGDCHFVSEPEAAATFYAAEGRIAVGQTVAVFDFGGGTFDAAVIQRSGQDTYDLIGRARGLERLGGLDLDEAVFQHALRSAQIDLADLDNTEPTRQGVSRLRSDARSAKEALSFDTSATISVFLPTEQTSVRLTRGEFEGLMGPVVDDAVDTLELTVTEAGLGSEDIDGVLLVGGSSRIPLVGQVVAQRLGRPVLADAHPKHAIALGAAITPAATSSTTSIPSISVGTSQSDEQAASAAFVAAASALRTTPEPAALETVIREPGFPGTPTPVPGPEPTAPTPSRRLRLTFVAVLVLLAAGLGAFLFNQRGDDQPTATLGSQGALGQSPAADGDEPEPATPEPDGARAESPADDADAEDQPPDAVTPFAPAGSAEAGAAFAALVEGPPLGHMHTSYLARDPNNPPGPGPDTLPTLAWQTRLDGSFRGAVGLPDRFIAEQNGLIGDVFESNVVAIDAATGAELWRNNVRAPIVALLASPEAVVSVTSRWANLHDPDTGDVFASMSVVPDAAVDVDLGITHDVRLFGETLLVLRTSSVDDQLVLTAFDLVDQAIRWEHVEPVPPGPPNAGMVSDGSTVLTMTSSAIVAVDMDSGAILWDDRDVRLRDVAAMSAGVTIIRLTGSPFGLAGRDSRTGEELWTLARPPVWNVAVDDTRAFAFDNDAVIAVDLTDGRILWESISPTIGLAASAPTDVALIGDTVVLFSTDGRIEAYDATNGATEWLVAVDAFDNGASLGIASSSDVLVLSNGETFQGFAP